MNSYGAEFGDKLAFGKLLRACGEITGLERVRFTSPHPRDFTDDVIEAMRDTPNVMPSLHMPLQSGSDRLLKAMRRAYRRDRYLAILDNVRARIPQAAITTDIIVGFPGETEEDFQGTLDTVRQARFSSAFTFQYSIREGTPAATMPDQVPQPVVQDRYERLVALMEQISTEENAKQDGAIVEVLVAEGEGRKDAATHRMSGRARDNRLVHFAPRHQPPPRRYRHHPRHEPRAALPARRRRSPERPPHPRRRRLGGPPAKRRARDRSCCDRCRARAGPARHAGSPRLARPLRP